MLLLVFYCSSYSVTILFFLTFSCQPESIPKQEKIFWIFFNIIILACGENSSNATYLQSTCRNKFISSVCCIFILLYHSITDLSAWSPWLTEKTRSQARNSGRFTRTPIAIGQVWELDNEEDRVLKDWCRSPWGCEESHRTWWPDSSSSCNRREPKQVAASLACFLRGGKLAPYMGWR